MKQLKVPALEAIRGGSWACLEAGLSALFVTAETGPGSLLAGVITYSACSLFVK